MSFLPVIAAPDSVRSNSNLTGLFLEGRSASTIRAYRTDLNDFAAFLGATMPDALASILSASAGQANEVVLRYRNALLQRGLKPTSVNRRLAALRSIVAFARTMGMIDWQLAIRSVKTQAYRDTRGPGVEGVRAILSKLRGRGDAKGARDTVLVRLMFDCALRCAEVISLDMEHASIQDGVLLVLRKGRTERERISIPSPTRAALTDWLAVRGDHLGPLFTNLDRAKKGHRLTANGLYRVVRQLGKQIGLKVRPHGLRHAAVTRALELTSGDVRSVAKFSSHRSIQTVLLYDDARNDVAGQIASLVAESV